MDNPTNGTERSLGRLEGKLDLIIKDVSELNASFHELEQGRLSRLEIQFSNLTGKLTIVAAVVSIGISALFFILQYFVIK